jgi:hypothetical protein
MFARVTTIEADRDRIDETLPMLQEQVLGDGQGPAGAQGAYVLVDRAMGRVITITLWDSRASLKASEAQADRVRVRLSNSLWAQSTPVDDIYEVIERPES